MFFIVGKAIESATGDMYGFTLKIAAINFGGVTSLVGGELKDAFRTAGATNWIVNAIANDTTDSLDIKVTGELTKTINWEIKLLKV